MKYFFIFVTIKKIQCSSAIQITSNYDILYLEIKGRSKPFFWKYVHPNFFFLQETMLICLWQHGVQSSNMDRIKRSIISSISINSINVYIWFYFLFYGHGGSVLNVVPVQLIVALIWLEHLFWWLSLSSYVPTRTQWAQTDPVKLSQERQ